MDEQWPEGMQLIRPVVDITGRLLKHELPLRSSTTLLDMTDEYSFFTPAILYILGILNDHPLIEFMYEYQREVPFFWRRFDKPLFRGLEVDDDPGWNHALWALQREHWDVFCSFYCSLAVSNIAPRRLFRVGMQLIDVVDPLAVMHHDHVP